MATYGDLLADVLTLCDQTGVTPASDIAQLALRRAMQYVAARVYIPSLISSATYTWQDGDTEAALVGGFGITLTNHTSPYFLLVGDAANDGTPYVYRDWMEWLQLKSVPARGYRDTITEAPTLDERPNRTFTINPSNEIVITPVPSEDDVITYFYRTPPAAYASGTTPEIHSDWDHILVDGAVAWVQAWERNQDEIITPGQIFKALDPAIKEMDVTINSGRQRRRLKLAANYRIPG